jgi:dTDP-4-dehydrorhamnose reductase
VRVLVTGASGLLGAHLMAGLSTSHDVVGVDRHPWWGEQPLRLVLGDLTDPDFLPEVMARERPEIVLHCAANVNVDDCETDPAAAYRDNAELTRNVARAAPANCLVVYITTDGIFKGDKPFADETELPCPRTIYARSKLQGEWEVQLATGNCLIVRTNFYGWSSGRKKTSAEWLFEALRQREPITLFDDFYFTPIYVVDLVDRLQLLVETDARGIFHLCGRDRVSKYEFGMLLAAIAGLPTDQVRRGSIREAPLRAPRPTDMSLRSDRFCAVTGRDVPNCVSGLERFVADRGRDVMARFASLAGDRALSRFVPR